MEPKFQKLLMETMKGLREGVMGYGTYTPDHVKTVALTVLSYVYGAVGGDKLPDPGNRLPVIFEGE